MSAAVAVAGGVLQPVLGVYSPLALDTLRAADSDAALTATVEALDPVRVALPPPLVRSVNTPDDLALLESGSLSQSTRPGR
jgi:molybdopterin-guanine dinucleotide biosynthesis protein A